jgi:hypothetical protein
MNVNREKKSFFRFLDKLSFVLQLEHLDWESGFFLPCGASAARDPCPRCCAPKTWVEWALVAGCPAVPAPCPCAHFGGSFIQ